MRLPKIAIENYQFTVIVFLLLMVAGILSFFTMPRSEDPQFNYSAAMIAIVSPGTTPQDMEKLIIDPIEREINEIDDIFELRSTIEDGLATMRIEFLYGTDPDDKYDDVVSAIAKIRDQLPENISDLRIDKASPTDVSILQLALVSEEASYLEIKKHADALEKKISRASGIKKVDILALPFVEVQVQVDLKRLNALGISLAQVENAISSAAKNIPGGYANAGEKRFTIRSSGDYQSLAEIENTAIVSQQEKTVYLRDIAFVSFGEGLPSYKARYNGKPAVFLSVVQRAGTQIFHVTDEVEHIINAYKKRLPSSIELQTVTKQSDSVAHQLNGFFDNLYQGLLLVAVLSLLFLGFKSAIIIITAIPLSIFIAIGWVDLSGFGLNQMSIVGLVIALGLLVDNAIVVVENVGRHLRLGEAPINAAIKGSSQVAWAVASGTLTTVLAFVPLLMMQNGPGAFLRAMPVTVILTLAASLLIALALTPLLAAWFNNKQSKMTFLQSKLQAFADGPYINTLKRALQYPKTVLSIAVIALLLSLSLFPYIGVSLFPKAEKPMLLINVEMPEGSTFEQTNNVVKEIEKKLAHYPEVTGVASNIGRGNPRIYYNILPLRQTVGFAQLFLTLESGELSMVEPLVDELRQDFSSIIGTEIFVKELLQGPPFDAPIEIQILSDSLEDIQNTSDQVEQLMRKMDGLVAIENPIRRAKVDLQLQIDREKAAMLGINLSQLDDTIRTALIGKQLGVYHDEDGDDYAITLRLSEYPEPSLEILDLLQVPTQQGQLIPLKHIAEMVAIPSIARYQHYDRERMSAVIADVKAGYNTAELTDKIINQLEDLEVADSVHFRIGGEQANRVEAFSGMVKATLLAVMAILAVLVMQFRSLLQPLIVFTAIPFALIGSFLALFLTGYTFSFTAFIGLTSLVGIVVNNAIILVDYANQMREEGMSIREAVAESAHTRFLPIMLTTLTTVSGLIPLTLSGSSMWAPLGWVIIGGLLLSTFLTLIIVPVLYQFFSNLEQA